VPSYPLERPNLSKALEGLSEGWIPASDLKIGDEVLTSSGKIGVVTLVRAYQKPQEMYNLEVARANSFSVGSSGWIVHNAVDDDNEFARLFEGDPRHQPPKQPNKVIRPGRLVPYANTHPDTWPIEDIRDAAKAKEIGHDPWGHIGDRQKQRGYSLEDLDHMVQNGSPIVQTESTRTPGILFEGNTPSGRPGNVKVACLHGELNYVTIIDP
jgi:hypothetical protein